MLAYVELYVPSMTGLGSGRNIGRAIDDRARF